MDALSEAALFGVLSHPIRLTVVALLSEREPRTADELQNETELERTALSHRLRLLKEARLVVAERLGRRQLYCLADHHVAHIVCDAIAHVSEET